MGAVPWQYFTAYQEDTESVIEKLKNREFRAGRYYPVLHHLPLPITDATTEPAPGPRHDSLEEVMLAGLMGCSGSRSILDILGTSPEPAPFMAAPFAEDLLLDLFETTLPTREMVDQHPELFDEIDSMFAFYLIVYKEGLPHEVMFAGYSAD